MSLKKLFSVTTPDQVLTIDINNNDDVILQKLQDKPDHLRQEWTKNIQDEVNGWFTLWNEDKKKYLSSDANGGTVTKGTFYIFVF